MAKNAPTVMIFVTCWLLFEYRHTTNEWKFFVGTGAGTGLFSCCTRFGWVGCFAVGIFVVGVFIGFCITAFRASITWFGLWARSTAPIASWASSVNGKNDTKCIIFQFILKGTSLWVPMLTDLVEANMIDFFCVGRVLGYDLRACKMTGEYD